MQETGNRALIERTVSRNPGIAFSELKRKTGLATGVVQYHLRKSDEVIRRKNALLEKGFCGNCIFRDICGEKCIYSILRKEVTRDVLELKTSGEKNKEIAEELAIHPSTVTYHVQKLERAGLLQ